MKIDIITIFPKIFDSYFSESIIKRSIDKGLVEINITNLRDYTNDKHHKTDDTPYGGGPGMVMMVEPIHKALNDLKEKDSYIIAMTAKGRTYKQSIAREYSSKTHIIVICGHYGGFDQRILDTLVNDQISIGNFVLTGGEIPAMIIVDSVTRLIPGALGNDNSPKLDSFYEDDINIQYPIYTKPYKYEVNGKILTVPDILLSGDHAKITQWKEKNKHAKT